VVRFIGNVELRLYISIQFDEKDLDFKLSQSIWATILPTKLEECLIRYLITYMLKVNPES